MIDQRTLVPGSSLAATIIGYCRRPVIFLSSLRPFVRFLRDVVLFLLSWVPAVKRYRARKSIEKKLEALGGEATVVLALLKINTISNS